MSQISKIVCLIFLAVCALWDIRTKKIWVIWVGINALIALIMAVSENKLIFSLTGMLPGLVLVIMSVISKGRVGMGDALVCCGTGCFTGVWGSFFIIMMGSFLVSLWGGVLVLTKHISIKRAVAFTPFLLISYIIMLFCMGGFS